VDRHLLGGLAMGFLAILAGAGLLAGALRRRGRGVEGGATYAAAGGPLYTVFQIGCAGLLILGGAGILGLVLLGGSPR